MNKKFRTRDPNSNRVDWFVIFDISREIIGRIKICLKFDEIIIFSAPGRLGRTVFTLLQYYCYHVFLGTTIKINYSLILSSFLCINVVVCFLLCVIVLITPNTIDR